MLAQRLVDVGGAHVQLAHLPSQSGETSGQSCMSWGSAGAGTQWSCHSAMTNLQPHIVVVEAEVAAA